MSKVDKARERVAEMESEAAKARGELAALEAQAEAVARLRKARATLEQAHADYMAKLVEADKTGATVPEIIDAAGITRRTFYKWVRQGDAPTQVRRR